MGTRQHKAHSQKTDSRAPRGRRPGSRPFSRPRCPAPRHRVHSPLPAVLCLTQTIPRGRHLFQEAVPKSQQHLTSNLSHSRSLSTPSPLCVSSPPYFILFSPPKLTLPSADVSPLSALLQAGLFSGRVCCPLCPNSRLPGVCVLSHHGP